MAAATSNQDPYGFELASAVAAALEAGEVIMYAHREYCGMGIEFRDGRFVYGEVYDGDIRFSALSEEAGAVFQTRHDFVTWLAAQSDESLSGRELRDSWFFNNQRIDRQRLEGAVFGARTRDRG